MHICNLIILNVSYMGHIDPSGAGWRGLACAVSCTRAPMPHVRRSRDVSSRHVRRATSDVREKSERIVSTNIIQKDNDTQAEKFEIAPQAEKFEIADTKITRIKFTDRWKVENEILSQIILQSSSQKEKKYEC